MTNLIFIDQNVPNSQLLISALPPDSQYFLLDDKQDGIQQIADILQGWQNLDSIQIFSHGASGTLTLGSSVINNQNLKNYQLQLEQIGKSLSASGDLLLYGCDVAQGDNGQAFVNTLAQLTGADVAASNDLTGSAALGGNWTLESVTGAIESPLLNTDSLDAYTGILAAITGTAGNDSLNGTNGDDVILGLGGNDNINAGAGNDSIDAGEGDDTISVIANYVENDSVSGGAGTDSLSIDYSGNNTDLKNGGLSWSGVDKSGNKLGWVGNLSNFNSVQTLLSLAVKLNGSVAFSSYISGYSFYYGVTFDVIEKLSIVGTNYDDLLVVQGNVNYDGKGGIDTLYADWSSSTTALNLDNSALTSHTLNGSTVSNIERLLVKTGSGNDVIKTGDYGNEIYSNAGNDTITSGNGNDTVGSGSGNDSINAGTGSDSIDAGDGDDVIYANAGNDSVNAGAGNDVLNGEAGNDTLTGGTGNDLFVFNTQPNNTTNVDLITDFVSGKDQLQFSKAVFTGLNSAAGIGNGSSLNATEFVSSTTATQGTTASSHLIYNTTSGVLYYDADGNAAGAAVKVAILGATTHPALVASDILIVA